MSRCSSTTLPIFRFPFSLRAAARVLSCAAGAYAAFAVIPAPVSAQTPQVPSAAAVTDSGTASADEGLADAKTQQDPFAGFDARQKVLDQRGAANDYRYAVAQHDCYSKFFVNHCLGKARDTMRVEQADIRKEQLALNAEERTARARQRDEQIALQRAQDEANAPQRAANEAANQQQFDEKQRQHELDQAQRNAEAPQRAANEQAYEEKQRQHAIDQAQRGISPPQAMANQQAYDQKQADFQRKLDEAHQQAAQNAQQRVEKQQHFEQKQIDAAQHKADVEARQKQAAEKAQQKQQQQLQQQQQLEQEQKQQQQQQ
jgi:hypothetical protein